MKGHGRKSYHIVGQLSGGGPWVHVVFMISATLWPPTIRLMYDDLTDVI